MRKFKKNYSSKRKRKKKALEVFKIFLIALIVLITLMIIGNDKDLLCSKAGAGASQQVQEICR